MKRNKIRLSLLAGSIFLSFNAFANDNSAPELQPNADPGTGSSNYAQYQPGAKYNANDIVSNGGKDYICLIAAWCSGSAAAYEPGVGFGWQSAWSIYGADPEPGPEISQKELEEKENQLLSGTGIEQIRESIRTLDNAAVEKIKPGSQDNPPNVQRVEEIVSAQTWDFFFPHRDPAYTYDNFLKAVGKFPVLCGDVQGGGDANAICRKTLATMFAHFTQETGEHAPVSDVGQWQQGLHWVREMGLTENDYDKYTGATCDSNTWQGKVWPCATDDKGNKLSYFGRGAKQLSYNFNYGAFSQAMYGDVNVLLKQPQLVADTWLNLASAIFFYIQPQPPKPSMQAVIDGSWQPNERDLADGLVPGFGVTTQIINGGVECGGSEEIQQSQNRISYYREFAKQLGVPVPGDEVLGCKGMKQFSDTGSAAKAIFWVKDDSWVASNPGGRSYACQLSTWQDSSYTALNKGDYAKCVQDKFPDAVIKD
jgi:chitodextrinase